MLIYISIRTVRHVILFFYFLSYLRTVCKWFSDIILLILIYVFIPFTFFLFLTAGSSYSLLLSLLFLNALDVKRLSMGASCCNCRRLTAFFRSPFSLLLLRGTKKKKQRKWATKSSSVVDGNRVEG